MQDGRVLKQGAVGSRRHEQELATERSTEQARHSTPDARFAPSAFKRRAKENRRHKKDHQK